MASTISLKTFKALSDKPNYKPLPKDKTLGLEPAIFFCEIEDDDKTEEVEEA